jgi:hypothetical protein
MGCKGSENYSKLPYLFYSKTNKHQIFKFFDDSKLRFEYFKTNQYSSIIQV